MARNDTKSYKVKRTYRLDHLTDKKIKLLKDVWKISTEGEIIDKIVGKIKI